MTITNLSTTWRYQEVTNVDPVDPNNPVIPTSGWLTGLGPFGDFDYDVDLVPQGDLDAVALTEPVTPWTADTGLWIEIDFTLDADDTVVIDGFSESNVYVYIDGVFVGSNVFSNSGFPSGQEFDFSTAVGSGAHTLSIFAVDDTIGGVDFQTYLVASAVTLGTVFPFQPQAIMTEDLKYLTDLTKSNNGTETSLKLRNNPRRYFKCQFPVTADLKAFCYDLLSEKIRESLLFPIWTEAHFFGSISPAISLSFDTTPYHYGLPVLIWESDTNWQLVSVVSNSGSALTFNETLQSFDNAWVIPLRTAYYPEGLKKFNTSLEATFEVEFRLLENYSRASSDPEQYLGEELFTKEFESGRAGKAFVEELSTVEMKVFDSETGLVSTSVDLANTRTSRNMNFLTKNYDEYVEMLDFLYRRSGRAVNFWQPSFDTDLIPVGTGTIGSTLDVKPNLFNNRFDKRNHIAVQEKDGTWSAIGIASVTEVDSTTNTLNLTGNLGIAYDAIKRISWLGKRRLGTDSVTIRHLTGGVKTTSFNTVEVEV